jgi:hypothetical protein
VLVVHGTQKFLDRVRWPKAQRGTRWTAALGSMSEFAYLASVHGDAARVPDLLAPSLRLADTRCRRLYKRDVTLHDEFLAVEGTLRPDQSVVK